MDIASRTDRAPADRFGPPSAVGAAAPIRRILLATDLGTSSSAATARALALARALDASLVVTSVVEPVRPVPGGTRADQLRDRRETGVRAITDEARRMGVRATFLVWQGEPGPAVVTAAEAEDADLIVLGTHGRAGVTRLLLGSVSDHVVRHAACPVLVVPPGDDRTDA
jgi:nucleotide-binding universal stress UspA family protein